MEWLSDDPTYLAGGLGIAAVAFLIALKLTQQGKFLVWAVVLFGLALGVVGIERLWVTDNERIEETVYALGRAVQASDASGTLALLTPDVQYQARGTSMPSAATRLLIERAVKDTTFDVLRITHLRTNAGGQSRRGTAEFQVLCGGSTRGSVGALNFGSANSSWSLGLRETSPGVWRVNRITPVSLPGGQNILPSAYLRPEVAPPTSSAPAPASRHRRRHHGPGRNRTSATRVPRPTIAEPTANPLD